MREFGERGKTTRIPDEVRAAVLVYVRETRPEGEVWAGSAEQVGLSVSALPGWSRLRRVREPREHSRPTRPCRPKVACIPQHNASYFTHCCFLWDLSQ